MGTMCQNSSRFIHKTGEFYRLEIISQKEIENFDVQLGEFLANMKEDDLVIITADHGNDPTYTGSDHTREQVPFLAYSPSHTGAGLLPVSKTFADIGATIADNFEVNLPEYGNSVLKFLK